MYTYQYLCVCVLARMRTLALGHASSLGHGMHARFGERRAHALWGVACTHSLASGHAPGRGHAVGGAGRHGSGGGGGGLGKLSQARAMTRAHAMAYMHVRECALVRMRFGAHALCRACACMPRHARACG